MTASKPPDKTLVGMPSDLKAVLQKLDQAAAEKASSVEQPDKTRMPRGASSERPRTLPPPLPLQRPAAAPAPQLPNAAAAPNAGGPMDRTLIGMPSEDMQAALQRALAEVGPPPGAAARRQPPKQPAAAAARTPAPQHPQPTAAEPVQALRAQPVRAIGIGGSPHSETQVPTSRAPAQPAHSASPIAARAYSPAASPGLAHSGVPYGPGLGYQSGSGYSEPAQPGGNKMNVLAPEAPLDWPPARRSEPGPIPRPEGLGAGPGSQPLAANAPPPAAANPVHTSAAPVPQLPAASGLGVPPMRLAPSDAVDATAATEASRLALPLKTLDGRQQRPLKKTSDAPPKRWPAISLILLAVVAFGGVIVLRAPHLLPASLSNLFAPTPAVPEELLGPEATSAPELASTAVPALATDTSAATDPAKTVQAPTPTRPPAAPAMTSGASAQLEKKAIEHLIANDYNNAKQFYEKLRSAEPSRAEFGVMVELLNRAVGPGCGLPGQPACAGTRP